MLRLRHVLLVPVLLFGMSVSAHAAPISTAPIPTVDVYEDFLCPYCAAFEQQYGAQLDGVARTGRVKLRHHFVDRLDRLSASGDYSSRAAGAARCVAKLAPARASAFRSRLFAPGTQPEEEGDADLDDGQLAQIAAETGAGAAAACVRKGEQALPAKAAAGANWTRLVSAGGRGVPSVLKDGALVDLDDPDWIASLES